MSEELRCRGTIKEIQRGGQFLVEVQDTAHTVRAYLSGKMKIGKITLCVGDIVDVILSPYDLDRGRIVWRYTKGKHVQKPK